jgi:hypothetical protein
MLQFWPAPTGPIGSAMVEGESTYPYEAAV